MRITARSRYFRNLAAAFLSVEWTATALRKAARLATGLSFHRMPPFLRRTLVAFPSRPEYEPLLAFLERDDSSRAGAGHGDYPIRQMFFLPARMGTPPIAAGPVNLPQVPTEAAL